MTTRSPTGDANQPLVLIVDDYEQNRKLARDVLRAAGFRTVEAASGAEAISVATERVPDVILMDLRLPDMVGTEVARVLAGDARTAAVPVVALSSVPLGERRGLPFVGSLEKPIVVGEFPDQVRRYCTGAEA
jgi:two-component system cell cycle response regulator DivK